MKFNATFIRAIALLQQHDGEAAAEQLFNALFVQAAVRETRTPTDLLVAARTYSGVRVYGADIRGINRDIGTPGPGWSSPVPWIKRAREVLGCGLKEAKDLHDFVRDNPTVAQA
jgi:hypothetical protein